MRNLAGRPCWIRWIVVTALSTSGDMLEWRSADGASSIRILLADLRQPHRQSLSTANYDHVDARLTLDPGKHAEEPGFDSLWVADHLMLGRSEATLEGWTMLSALSGGTPACDSA
ncbi:MAG: LLM class flavin-dependent oxidoreductase [Chloroflexia bacterium]|nr:LLM class flavin-dependent oxidoreductase [Chloroflexia bacterium]